jgi:glutamyl-tRNA synthetase
MLITQNSAPNTQHYHSYHALRKREFTVTVRVRIAPSPTGNLHIGTARTAVFNWLFARHHGGQFILRIEDTDIERSRPEFTDNILEGLRWLGLNWDEGPFFQSKRLEMYKEAVEKLLDQKLAYRCYTTAEELEAMREAQKARNEAPRYDNRHRNLTPEQEAAYKAEGRNYVIRFKIEDGREIVWNDLVRGKMSWRGSDLGGDMVIARASEDGVGQPLYNFAVVIDDVDMQITHVIRGEDHIANTAKQILLYEAMGSNVPEFAHTPLILNMDGRKLSKRDGVTSIFDFKEMGFTPEALVNYMTLLGWSPPDSTQEIFTLEEAAKQFSFERVNKAGAKFDWAKLDWLNSQYIHGMPVDKLTDLIIPYWQEAGYKIDSGRERPWLEKLVTLMSQSLTRLKDAVAMSQLFFNETVTFDDEATAQLKQEGSAAVLQGIVTALENQKELTEASAQDIIKQVVKQQNVKKGLVMRSLRAALTGEVHGPDLIQSWLLLNQIGLDKPRLLGAIAVGK